VPNIAVILLDGKDQVFSGIELFFGDNPVVSLPMVGEKTFAFDADFIEKFPQCGVITPTQYPGHGASMDRIIGAPELEFSLFF
jgi:hypothetical protein